jgi:hypothetical protein
MQLILWRPCMRHPTIPGALAPQPALAQASGPYTWSSALFGAIRYITRAAAERWFLMAPMFDMA